MKSLAILSILIFQFIASYAEVSKIVIEERIIIADGYHFGEVGQYEKIRGRYSMR